MPTGGAIWRSVRADTLDKEGGRGFRQKKKRIEALVWPRQKKRRKKNGKGRKTEINEEEKKSLICSSVSEMKPIGSYVSADSSFSKV